MNLGLQNKHNRLFKDFKVAHQPANPGHDILFYDLSEEINYNKNNLSEFR